MIKHIKHVINLVRHHFRDLGVSAKRSGKWPTVEKHFKEEHPKCEACGTLRHLQVHHITPFHHDPDKELEPENLITLCMSRRECHLNIGHSGNFKLFNIHVRRDAAEALADPSKFYEIVKRASEHTKIN